MLVIYITVILAEGDDAFFEVLPWALLMAIAPLGAFGSAAVHDRRSARMLMVGSAVLFTILGLVSILSIGLGFLVAAFFAWGAAIRLSGPDPS
jgi:hypothetical protein